jgi:hypothetical protein
VRLVGGRSRFVNLEASESRTVSAPIAANLALRKSRRFEPPSYGTGGDAYFFGNGQLRMPLPTELDHQLIALIALLSAAQAACLDQRQSLGRWLALTRSALGVNGFTQCRSGFQLQPLDITFQRFAQITHQMITIRDLFRRGGTLVRAVGVQSTAIAGDDLDLPVLAQPRGETVSGSF